MGDKMDIKNIFCVGRNYVQHAKELGNEPPEVPMIFMKPTHSVVYADGSTITLPRDEGDIHYEAELVLYVGAQVSGSTKVNDIVTKMALGVDFTLRDVQTKLKEKGHPWLLAKGFKNAALLTEFWDFPGEANCQSEDFMLIKNNKIVQKGQAQEMIFNLQTLIDYIHHTFGLSEGDVIFTGTPKGVGSVRHGDQFKLLWGVEEKGRFGIN